MSIAENRIRDQLRRWVPWFLSDRQLSSGKSVGFRFIWVMIAFLDAFMEMTLQALLAAWPGAGTPSALPYIGRSRGILRGELDTDAEYSSKLRQWLDKWLAAGTARQLAIELHEYLGNHPMVRVVNRAGFWVTVAADGTVTTAQQPLDWDSVSHPGRAGYWSDMWIIVYPTQWAATGGTWGDGGTWGLGDGGGISHVVGRTVYEAARGLLAQWKAAHSRVRAVIWTSDVTLFDPNTPASLPDGEWGDWGTTGAAARVQSNRNYSTCHYWEC